VMEWIVAFAIKGLCHERKDTRRQWRRLERLGGFPANKYQAAAFVWNAQLHRRIK
jgi:hypothetical protein